MRKQSLFLLLIAFLCSLHLKSQDLTLTWSDKNIYDNKIDGFFAGYFGNNSTYVYAKFSNLTYIPRKKDSKIKMIALDKTTLKKVGELKLVGYPQTKSTADLDFYKTICLENIVYVLWTKEEKSTIDIYVESFDAKLNRLSKLKKIYSLIDDRKNSDKLVVLSNKNAGNIILIGKELGIQEKEDVLKFEYNVVSENLSVKSSGVVELPIVVRRASVSSDPLGGTSVSYELGDNGKIYVYDYIKRDKDEVKKGEDKVYPIVVQINPSNGKSKSYNVKFDNKRIFQFQTIVTKTGISLCGFFSDLEKDAKGRDTHGIFYVSMDENEFKNIATRFNYFDKPFLDQLYAKDKGDQRKSKKKDEKRKKSIEESIDGNYVIEVVRQEGKDLFLFCSIMYNWTETVCTQNSNGTTNCRQVPHCDKRNVTAFRISSEGKMVWASNLNRFYSYIGHNIFDVHVLKKDNQYVVLYNDIYRPNTEKQSRKSKEEVVDGFDYATFDASNGSFAKKDFRVNAVNTPRKERKVVSSNAVTDLDNTFYISSTRYSLKPVAFLYCLLGPCGYFGFTSGNMRKGQGYLGSITAAR